MITRQVTDILQKEGILAKSAVAKLRDFEALTRGNVLDFCLEERLTPKEKLIPLLRDTHFLPVVDLLDVEIDIATAKLLPAAVCMEHTIIPFRQDNASLHVAMVHPDNPDLIAFIEKTTGKKVVPVLAHRAAMTQVLDAVFHHSVEDIRSHIQSSIEKAKVLRSDPETMAKEIPIIALLNTLISFGLASRASDLHIEPTEAEVVLRFRIDGMLHEIFRVPQELHAALIARVKILARLRIDEHLRPQDGRFTSKEGGRNIAVRVSIIPTLHGQKAALRFLETDTGELSLSSLGLEERDQAILRGLLSATSGLILVTGPTGSGKTTTLYGMLTALRKGNINISTIEDPIEYHVNTVNQMQVNPHVGLTFSEGLRSLLRQDPDVLMVGEIRDRETAQIAINAALTGHLVISSLHTNSAAAAIPRLIDMGIEPYLITSTLRAVLGQRLVRVICDACKATTGEAAPSAVLTAYQRMPGNEGKPMPVTRGKGCAQCLGTGYEGRSGIFEILPITPAIHDLVMQRHNATTLEERAAAEGFVPLLQDGVRKVCSGTTTPEELLRVIS